MHRVELRAKFVHTAVEPSQLSFKEVSKLLQQLCVDSYVVVSVISKNSGKNIL